MSSRNKRSVRGVQNEVEEAPEDDGSTIIHRMRNMWQFANFCQWMYIFGRAANIDESIDVDEIEAECLKPNPTLLADLALSILKLVSSQRGLTHDVLDDQLRKQYLARAPQSTVFGDNAKSNKFSDLNVFTKIKVLQQLTQWTMTYPERIREKMEEQKDIEQMSWRIEPYGWDREDRTYFVLDDNRVYRLTEKPPVQARQKARARPKTKSRSSRPGRSDKRQPAVSLCDLVTDDIGRGDDAELNDDGLGGRTWECVAVTLEDVQVLLENLAKTRDENERVLRRQLEAHLVPILEKEQDSQKRKQVQRERELLLLAKMANAKRSSRIAGKVERQKLEDQAKEEEQREREAEASKQREEQEHLRMEKNRDFRMFSRQRRMQERDARRLQHEEELAQLSQGGPLASTSGGRVSERRLHAEIERNKEALEKLNQEEEEWAFDCVCGLFGQVDDGTHSVACEKCNVWQHSKCLGISEAEADRPEFHFVCDPCKQRVETKSIKLKLNPTDSSNAPIKSAEQANGPPSTGQTVHDDCTPNGQNEELKRQKDGPDGQNEEPARQNEEPARQNEEPDRQTDELGRQNDETWPGASSIAALNTE